MNERINPTPNDFMVIGDRYRGRGASGDEWAMTYCKGDPTVTFYSGVGTEVYAMCKRLQSNPGACLKVRDTGTGVFFHLRPAEVRSPAMLVQKSPPEVRMTRAARALKRDGGAS